MICVVKQNHQRMRLPEREIADRDNQGTSCHCFMIVNGVHRMLTLTIPKLFFVREAEWLSLFVISSFRLYSTQLFVL